MVFRDIELARATGGHLHVAHVSTRGAVDLIRRANHITTAVDDGFQLWHDNNADGTLTANELTQVARGIGGDTLTIGANESYGECKNISFAYDDPSGNTRFITVSFDISENGQTQRHSVNARLRVSDEHRQF